MNPLLLHDLERIQVLTTLVAANRVNHHQCHHTIYVALSCLLGAANAAVYALRALARSRDGFHSEPVRSVSGWLSDDITGLVAQLHDFDYARIESDVRYAGSQWTVAKAIQAWSCSVQARSVALEALIAAETGAHTTGASLKAILKKNRPLVKVAVVKSDFTDTQVGWPVEFHEGEHCDISIHTDDGAQVAGGDLLVYFTTARLQEHFDIVEC